MNNKEKEKKAFIRMLQNLIITLCIIWAVFAFFIGVKMAPNDDMEPRISAGDIIVYYRIAKTPNARDVIVLSKNDTTYIGRVVARPGDIVEVTAESNLKVNGHTMIEKDIYGTTPLYEGFVTYPLTLKSDEYFILVDKREGGEDSRYYGVVSKSEIDGVIIGLFRKNSL